MACKTFKLTTLLEGALLPAPFHAMVISPYKYLPYKIYALIEFNQLLVNVLSISGYL